MKWLVTFGILALAIGGFAWWFLSHTGPRQLDMVDQIYPDEGSAQILAKDVVFDADNDLSLNIWRPGLGGAEENLEWPTNVKPHPVIVFIYGGGWRAGSKDEYGFAGRAFANKGYVTVLPDYRLFPDTKFPGFLEDSAAAVAWVHDNIAEFGGDPDRIFIAGQSAGAYNVTMLALDQQWLGREGKTTDFIKGVAVLAGPADFYPFSSETTKQSFGDYPKPEMTQPINFVRTDAPPLWLSTGVDDTQVEPRNSRSLRDKMQAVGGQVEYIEYPDMDHLEIMMAVAKPFRHKGPVLDDMIAFFERQQ